MDHQRYTPEFKNEAARQVTEQGHSVLEVAARLGVSSHSRYKSLQAVSPGTDEQRNEESLDAKKEILKLRAKLRRTAFEQIIQPRLGDLYDYTSRVLEIPELARLNRDGLLTYPEETPVAPDLIEQEIGDSDWSAGLQQLIERDA